TYRINWVEYKQKQLHDLIEEQENEIRLSRIRIENYHSAMEELLNDSDFLTEEEEEERNNDLLSLEKSIQEEETSIETVKEEIEILEDRIALYEEQKQSVLSESSE